MCRRGDEAAWAYLYNYVLCIARSRRFRLREAPEDIAQSVVCRLLEKGIDCIQDSRAFRAYVRRVSLNLILDSLKRKVLFTRSLDGDQDEKKAPLDPVSDNPGPEEVTLGADFARTLESEMARLPDNCRNVLDYYIDYKMGHYKNYKALAEKIGKSIGTLSSQVKRCLDILRRAEPIKLWIET